jgi:hypothetical protein
MPLTTGSFSWPLSTTVASEPEEADGHGDLNADVTGFERVDPVVVAGTTMSSSEVKSLSMTAMSAHIRNTRQRPALPA